MHTRQLILQNFKKIPELFDRNDFEIMINSIEKCSLYPKDIYWRSWMKARDKCILSLLFYLGLRPKEACSLRYDDFKSKIASFHIRGENNKQKKDRIMPLCENLIEPFRNYLAYGRFSNYLFPSFENRAKPLSSSTWKRIMREKILKPCGLWICPVGKSKVSRTRSYSFRASYGTRLFQLTKDMQLVAKALGHSDFRSVNRYVFLSNMNESDLENIRKAETFHSNLQVVTNRKV